MKTFRVVQSVTRTAWVEAENETEAEDMSWDLADADFVYDGAYHHQDIEEIER